MIQFTVPLRAAPQGSKTLGRYGQMYESSKRVKPYRKALAVYAKQAMRGHKMLTEPIHLTVTFCFKRAKSNHDPFPTSRMIGDLSKLVRATEDALTGIVWKDDCLIVGYPGAFKCYDSEDAVTITVREVIT